MISTLSFASAMLVRDVAVAVAVMRDAEGAAAIALRRVAGRRDERAALLGVRTCGTISPMAPMSSSKPFALVARAGDS